MWAVHWPLDFWMSPEQPCVVMTGAMNTPWVDLLVSGQKKSFCGCLQIALQHCTVICLHSGGLGLTAFADDLNRCFPLIFPSSFIPMSCPEWGQEAAERVKVVMEELVGCFSLSILLQDLMSIHRSSLEFAFQHTVESMVLLCLPVTIKALLTPHSSTRGGSA